MVDSYHRSVRARAVVKGNTPVHLVWTSENVGVTSAAATGPPATRSISGSLCMDMSRRLVESETAHAAAFEEQRAPSVVGGISGIWTPSSSVSHWATSGVSIGASCVGLGYLERSRVAK
jgi:hypothetical protein